MLLDTAASPAPVPATIPYALRTQTEADAEAIEAILDRAFGPGRQAKRSYAYRDGVDPVNGLSLVATRPDDSVIGTLRFWPVWVDDAAHPALLLGPIAVLPELKGLGIGKALMRRGLHDAARMGHRLVVLVGDLSYYRIFGFRPAAPLGLVMPHERPHRLLALELTEGAAKGGGILLPAHSAPMATAHAPHAV